METRKLSPRAGLAALALVLAIAAIWAATALAAGGSSPAGSTSVGSGGGLSPPRLVASTPEKPAAPSGDDCPGRDGSGGGSSPTDGSSSTNDAV